MERQTATPVWTNLIATGMVDALFNRPAAALAPTPKVGLFTAVAGGVRPDMNFIDFTEATFGGYGQIALPITNPMIVTDNAKNWAQIGGVVFSADSTVVSPGELVLGYMLLDAAGTGILMAETFLDPVTFDSPGDFLSLTVLLPATLFPICG